MTHATIRFLSGRGFLILIAVLILCIQCGLKEPAVRIRQNFGQRWKFHLGDVKQAAEPNFDDSEWRVLNLPHDWSIEGQFSPDNPATPGGGALPGGIGWYRKSFHIPAAQKDKLCFIDFDGIYRNSEVWINGHYLGQRPYGYISFRYDLTPYLKHGKEENILAVRVDNSQQPNSRWYSGSGIYRNVWFTTVGKVYLDHWGIFITTPEINENNARVNLKIKIRNTTAQDQPLKLMTKIFDADEQEVTVVSSVVTVLKDSVGEVEQNAIVQNPCLWSVNSPYLYRAVTQIWIQGKVVDDEETTFGIRSFTFDSEKGFFLNGVPMKIQGVCNHHDLGCLGAAVNPRAIERQLEIMRGMGVNSIRTSHNPPAPELLDLCDRMGFLVMDEAFDMWRKNKTPHDYALNWEEWHERDLTDMVRRDRNHPSVIIWSIGNEVIEQWDRKDSSGIIIAKELAEIVRSLDPTRPITAACNDPNPLNPVIKSGALDLIGYNYSHRIFEQFPETFPGQKFIGSETTSALATRGHYDMPSDSIRRWPVRWDLAFKTGNPDNTCSAYDNCSAPWGSTQEETWKIVRKHAFLSGIYIWTGFDYLGEPTPYNWPSRSSYFGIVDLAGFPKDSYYFYQSEWTDEPVLHLLPHWNWQEGEVVDVWVYTNCPEVELFLNDVSQGIQRKSDENLHLMWRLNFIPGILKAVGREDGQEILTDVVKTAGLAAKITLEADRTEINADDNDLSFITVRIQDQVGTLVPDADNLIHFDIRGPGVIAGVDNGLQTSHEPFQANYRKAFNGLCLAVIRATEKRGMITVSANSDGLESATIQIFAK